MSWLQRFIENLTKAADPRANARALIGDIDQQTVTMPDGSQAPVNIGIGIPTLGPGGAARGAVQNAGRALSGAGQRVAGAARSGRSLSGIPSAVRGGLSRVATDPRTPARIIGANAGVIGTAAGVEAIRRNRDLSSGATSIVDKQPHVQARTRGAPNQDIWNARQGAGGLAQGAQDPGMDPYMQYMQDYMDKLAGSYDAQIGAIGGLDPIFRDMAGESQENIGNFFGFAGDSARAGIPVTQDIYDSAQGNINTIYDNLSTGLQGIQGSVGSAASQAAGSAIGGSVADRVSAATAPFMAAGETSRANALANLTQHSSAGQNYLNQLASATGAEGAMHQSAVEQALNQQLQMIAFRQAEIEGAKQRALAGVSADIAGSSAERMANMALAEAMGIDIPPGVDPMDYMRLQQMQQGLSKGNLDMEERLNPNFQRDLSFSGLNSSEQDIIQRAMRQSEQTFDFEESDPRHMVFDILQNIDQMMAPQEGEGGKVSSGKGIPLSQHPRRSAIEEAVRNLFGGY